MPKQDGVMVDSAGMIVAVVHGYCGPATIGEHTFRAKQTITGLVAGARDDAAPRATAAIVADLVNRLVATGVLSATDIATHDTDAA